VRVKRGRAPSSLKGEQFTVTVGTMFERSKIPKWLAALFLLTASK
jgi:hypothetical protein